MDLIKDFGKDLDSKCLENLKKYIENKPEWILGEEGTLNDEMLYTVMTGELAFSIHLASYINKKIFFENLLKSEKFNATVIKIEDQVKRKDFLQTRGREMGFLIFVDPDILIVSTGSTFIYYCKNTDKKLLRDVVLLAQASKKKKKPKADNFCMITNNKFGRGLDLKTFKIKPYKVDIALNYNDDFAEVDVKIRTFLNEPNTNGIILLHGKPGTGKTSYVRYLIKSLDKLIIYIPLHLMDILSDPGFLEFMANYDKSILIIEDCEDMLRPRQDTQFTNQSLTNLLNLGDGLLSDALCIKVICTFNADLHDIDQAILRKGRMIARYEFKELSLQKTQQLLTSLDKNITAAAPMTLADIYNAENNDFSTKKSSSKIGYTANKN